MARFVVLAMDEAHAAGWHNTNCACNSGFSRHRWELWDTSTKPPTLVGQDGGEPEDQLLVRDWAWVVEALNAVDSEVARSAEGVAPSLTRGSVAKRMRQERDTALERLGRRSPRRAASAASNTDASVVADADAPRDQGRSERRRGRERGRGRGR